jgi:hypothetical protein
MAAGDDGVTTQLAAYPAAARYRGLPEAVRRGRSGRSSTAWAALPGVSAPRPPPASAWSRHARDAFGHWHRPVAGGRIPGDAWQPHPRPDGPAP